MTEKQTKPEAVASAQPAASFDLTLEDYCRGLSADKVGPELIGGFHHSCAVSGLTKASRDAFAQAYTAFINQPA